MAGKTGLLEGTFAPAPARASGPRWSMTRSHDPASGTLKDDCDDLVANTIEREESLEALLIREAPLSRDLALAIAGEVADALRVLHERGACHGRLDPTRVWVASSGRGAILVKLAEVGVPAGDESCEERGTLTRFDADVGFRGPELAAGEEPTSESDIWALGAIMSRYVTHVTPFEARRSAIAVGSVTPPKCDDDLAAVIALCLAQEPFLRPTAAEVLTTIRALQLRRQPADEPSPERRQEIPLRRRLAATGTGRANTP